MTINERVHSEQFAKPLRDLLRNLLNVNYIIDLSRNQIDSMTELKEKKTGTRIVSGPNTGSNVSGFDCIFSAHFGEF
jgi:hypothetical protein